MTIVGALLFVVGAAMVLLGATADRRHAQAFGTVHGARPGRSTLFTRDADHEVDRLRRRARNLLVPGYGLIGAGLVLTWVGASLPG